MYMRGAQCSIRFYKDELPDESDFACCIRCEAKKGDLVASGLDLGRMMVEEDDRLGVTIFALISFGLT